MKVVVKEYIGNNGRSPFADWFNSLSAQIATKVSTALVRIEMGNTSNVKGVGNGILEYRIHSGAGLRIYFGKDDDTLIILLGGGAKKQQQKDIKIAKDRWREYKERKRRNHA